MSELEKLIEEAIEKTTYAKKHVREYIDPSVLFYHVSTIEIAMLAKAARVLLEALKIAECECHYETKCYKCRATIDANKIAKGEA